MSSVCFDTNAHRKTEFCRVQWLGILQLVFPPSSSSSHKWDIASVYAMVVGESFQSNPRNELCGHCWNSRRRNDRNPFVYYILLKGASQPEQGMSIKSVFAVESPLHIRDRSDKRSRDLRWRADSSDSTLLWNFFLNHITVKVRRPAQTLAPRRCVCCTLKESWLAADKRERGDERKKPWLLISWRQHATAAPLAAPCVSDGL